MSKAATPAQLSISELEKGNFKTSPIILGKFTFMCRTYKEFVEDSQITYSLGYTHAKIEIAWQGKAPGSAPAIIRMKDIAEKQRKLIYAALERYVKAEHNFPPPKTSSKRIRRFEPDPIYYEKQAVVRASISLICQSDTISEFKVHKTLGVTATKYLDDKDCLKGIVIDEIGRRALDAFYKQPSHTGQLVRSAASRVKKSH